MPEKDQIKAVVYRSIDRVNELLLDENALNKDDATILLGENSTLDSMGFINFIVALEEELAQVVSLDRNLLERLRPDSGEAKRWSTVAELIDAVTELVRMRQSGSVEKLST
jgi:acyl carrier protein